MLSLVTAQRLALQPPPSGLMNVLNTY